MIIIAGCVSASTLSYADHHEFVFTKRQTPAVALDVLEQRGIKRIFADHLDIDGRVGLEPAGDGTVLVLGTGSHRYEVTFKGPGGHSFGAFGQVPSAIHGMGRAIAKIGEKASAPITFNVNRPAAQ